jgi:type 1 glutamine amidotransferase
MKHAFLLVALFSIVISTIARADTPTTRPASRSKIRLLIATGGHGFQSGPFFKLFDDNPEVTYVNVAEKGAAEVWDRDDLLDFDVVLLYDFQRQISEAQKARFLLLFDKGVGLIVLHHALLSYQSWPDYERIAGGKYLLDNEPSGETVTPASTYQGNVDIAVKVTGPTDHPVMAGLSDFVVRDEIYRGVRTRSDITTLLTAEDRPLAWIRVERNSRIVGIIIGHGPAYKDDNFRTLLRQSIRWSAKRS